MVSLSMTRSRLACPATAGHYALLNHDECAAVEATWWMTGPPIVIFDVLSCSVPDDFTIAQQLHLYWSIRGPRSPKAWHRHGIHRLTSRNNGDSMFQIELTVGVVVAAVAAVAAVVAVGVSASAGWALFEGPSDCLSALNWALITVIVHFWRGAAVHVLGRDWRSVSARAPLQRPLQRPILRHASRADGGFLAAQVVQSMQSVTRTDERLCLIKGCVVVVVGFFLYIF